MTDRTTQPPERARAITVTLADVGAAEKFRRGWGGKYDRDVNALAEAFAHHRSEGVREAVEAAAGICERRAAELSSIDGTTDAVTVRIAEIEALGRLILATLSPEEGG